MEKNKPNENIEIEICFDVPKGESISFRLNKEDSKRFVKLTKEYGNDFQVFTDYSDEG
jgi:hypothetical protein